MIKMDIQRALDSVVRRVINGERVPVKKEFVKEVKERLDAEDTAYTTEKQNELTIFTASGVIAAPNKL